MTQINIFETIFVIITNLWLDYKHITSQLPSLPVFVELYGKISHGLHCSVDECKIHVQLALTSRKCSWFDNKNRIVSFSQWIQLQTERTIGKYFLTSLFAFCFISIRTLIPGEIILLDENWIQNLKTFFILTYQKNLQLYVQFLRIYWLSKIYKTAGWQIINKPYICCKNNWVFKLASHKMHLTYSFGVKFSDKALWLFTADNSIAQ